MPLLLSSTPLYLVPKMYLPFYLVITPVGIEKWLKFQYRFSTIFMRLLQLELIVKKRNFFLITNYSDKNWKVTKISIHFQYLFDYVTPVWIENFSSFSFSNYSSWNRKVTEISIPFQYLFMNLLQLELIVKNIIPFSWNYSSWYWKCTEIQPVGNELVLLTSFFLQQNRIEYLMT